MQANILVLGNSGAGKSTLINSVTIVVMKKIENGEIKIEEIEKIEKFVTDYVNDSAIKFVNEIIDSLNKNSTNKVKLEDILSIIKNALSKKK